MATKKKTKEEPKNPYIGLTIKDIRLATEQEMEDFGFDYREDRPSAILVLNNGSKFIASRDAEGNGPGVIFTLDPDGGGSRLA